VEHVCDLLNADLSLLKILLFMAMRNFFKGKPQIVIHSAQQLHIASADTVIPK